MSELSTEQKVELETLRRVNADLLQTKHALKARIATLEGEAATLESRAEKAERLMRSAVIDVPMRKLAEGIAHVPSLFIAELDKDFCVDVDADSGELRLLTKADGKPATDGKGQPVVMTHNALYRHLAGSPEQQKDDPRKKVFATLMRYSGSSGGVGRKTVGSPYKPMSEDVKQDIAVTFGLR